MELTEVVAPHVAVPVFGVLLCAFLVFAFGFKSPAQPPSFNFDEDGKKKKPKKAKQQKSQTNGHVTAVTPETSLPIKSQPSPKHVDKPAKSSSPGNKTGKKAEVQTKKAKKTKEDVTAVPATATTKLKMEEDGWTTQVSRKDRKLKNKKEDKNDSGEEAEVKLTQVEEAPQEQRSKGKNKKKSTKEAAEPKEEAKVVSKAPEAPAKAVEVVSKAPEPPAKAVEVVSKAPEPPAKDVKVVGKAPAPVVKTPETSTVAKDNTGECVEAPFESPSKKNKGKKAAAVEVVKDQVDSAVKPSSPAATKKGKAKSPTPDKPATENAKPKAPEAGKSKSPSPDAGKPKTKDVKPAPEAAKPKSPGAGKDSGAKDSPSGDSKPVKSPKNKKKNEKTADAVVKETPQPVTPVAKPSVTETPAASSSTPAEGADSSAEAPQVVAFDEMGLTDSWTEAKPKGKKKKPRREN
ncbi:muscle M-line assembly protein unc-89-like [Pecten maximus]|uniref:muscle M-line assembly protein unc-89-like n=1 Tax=Pecten maximus TaxID=6579 RepID=UPI001458778E|nr:muscle M-line assembly protein unc-89-like [Pecten maximus]